jgi:excisionase family DNA binding protein
MSTHADRDHAPAPLMDVDDGRRYLGGISRQTLYKLVRDGDLTIVKLRRRSFLRRADLDALIAGTQDEKT